MQKNKWEIGAFGMASAHLVNVRNFNAPSDLNPRDKSGTDVSSTETAHPMNAKNFAASQMNISKSSDFQFGHSQPLSAFKSGARNSENQN